MTRWPWRGPRRGRGQSVTQIVHELGVGRSTFYRALKNDDPSARPTRSAATRPCSPAFRGCCRTDCSTASSRPACALTTRRPSPAAADPRRTR
ncbi:helix-turn-helix domain-containing protein [Nonomuraea sp. NPDC001831]|uniref:helix-turn-helix domain-containing protein n=1 Tax=Nonomuraea sp. NPDC001831 TaxID=3364340 RepID=UPI0036C8C6F7